MLIIVRGLYCTAIYKKNCSGYNVMIFDHNYKLEYYAPSEFRYILQL